MESPKTRASASPGGTVVLSAKKHQKKGTVLREKGGNGNGLHE